MAIAALVAGFQRGMCNLPGPLMGGVDRGVPFLQNVAAWAAAYPNARLVVEVAWGANLTADPSTWTWTDITADVFQANGQTVSISPMGRSDYTSKTQPAACTFVVNNASGGYSRGPQSFNYPNVHQNVPVRVWVTLTGATNDMQVLFQGEAWSMKPTWNKPGNVASVTVSAAGKLRQLQQGTKPIRNILTRYHLSQGAVAVWPFDDGGGATQAANAVPKGPAMQTNSVGANFGKDVSATFPAVNTAAVLHVPSAGVDVASAGINAPLRGLLHIDMWREQAAEPDASETQLLTIDLNDASGWSPIEVRARMSQTSPLVVAGYVVRVAGSAVMDSTTGSSVNPFDSSFHNVHVAFAQSGANVNATLYVDGAVADTHTFITATLPSQINTVHLRNSIVAGSGSGNFDTQSIIAINTTAAGSPSYAVGAGLYSGENAVSRMTRLFREEGVPLNIIGTSTTAMGPQGIDTFLNLARECEAADLGMLGDGLGPGCFYVTREARYNQAVTLALDATANDLADAPAPEDDDQKLRNKYTVTRKGGSSAIFEDTDGPLGTQKVGTYDSTPDSDLNLATDAPLLNYAAWLVGLGTVLGYRYPQLPLDLRNIQAKAAAWAAMRPGQHLTASNVATVSPQHPAEMVDVLAEGWSQQVTPVSWTAAVNCSQADPWNVTALSSNFRLELVGVTLAAGLSPGSTSFAVATAAGHQQLSLSSSFPADFPADLLIGGWKVHVTSSADSVTDTGSRTVSNGLGTADTGQVYTAVGGNPSDYSVGSGVLSLALNSVGASRKGILPALLSADFEAYATITCSATAVGAPIEAGIIGHLASSTDYYMLGVQFTTSGTVQPFWTRIGGAQMGIATQAGGASLSYSPGTAVNIHVKYNGTVHTANIWTTGSEPSGWQLTAIASDALLDPMTTPGIRTIAESGNTNTLPVTVTFDNLRITNPQMLTCDPTPNIYVIPAGTAVTLWKPAALAL